MTLDGPGLPRPQVVAGIKREAQAAEADPRFTTAVLDAARALSGRLALGGADPDDIRHAALMLESQASLDLEVPTASNLPGVAALKCTLKRLMIWYLRYLAAQITSLGQATSRLGIAVAGRVDRLDADIVELRARVAALEARAGSHE